jgi:putative glutathione S-transferase
MGFLRNGKWTDQWYDTEKSNGKFIREDSQFRQWIKVDKTHTFTPQKNRYHLYISHACPWAHRTLIFRSLKKLETIISTSSVDPFMHENGWEFKETSPDPLYQKHYLYEIYLKADPNYTGRVTVPVLWDKKTETIVNNESSEIIRILNTEFSKYTDNKTDYYPQKWRSKIDEINSYIYKNINNGVYKCGFASTQPAYNTAYTQLFSALDRLEGILDKQDYLIGNICTEADWRLFPTLIRFDAVYVSHFKCNKKRISDYPNLSRYLSHLYQYPGIKETVNLAHIKTHYYTSHPHLNPSGIIPCGPDLTWTE